MSTTSKLGLVEQPIVLFPDVDDGSHRRQYRPCSYVVTHECARCKRHVTLIGKVATGRWAWLGLCSNCLCAVCGGVDGVMGLDESAKA